MDKTERGVGAERETPERYDSPETMALLLRAREGESRAFDALLEQYAPLIEHQLGSMRMRRPELGAEDEKDLRQEAHLAFYRALLHYDMDRPEVSFGLYAKICMEHALISALRKMHPAVEPLTGELIATLPAGAEQDPTRHLREREDYDALWARISQLLSPYETAIWQRYMAGQTAAQIAQATGKDLRSVHNAIYRIRHKLRGEF